MIQEMVHIIVKDSILLLWMFIWENKVLNIIGFDH